MTVFFVGLHHEADAKRFGRCMVSMNTLLRRKGDFEVGDWILDSGAFMQIKQHGRFLVSPDAYAKAILRWSRCGRLLAAVCQDWMCEPFMLAETGRTVHEHQSLTLGSYCTLQSLVGSAAYVMPVLQGYDPADYVRHLEQYGRLLAGGQWVGVGSVCKRNRSVEEVENVLVPLRQRRPDLRLHGFGVKKTALASKTVRDCLWSADSMAWSAAARWEGRDSNSWREAQAFAEQVDRQQPVSRPFQRHLF